VSLLWLRPPAREARLAPDERRIRDFVDSRAGVSESVESLSAKLGLSPRRCRRVLEQLVQEGLVRRRDFDDMEPLYSRFPDR
jgi:hypothetical protein